MSVIDRHYTASREALLTAKPDVLSCISLCTNDFRACLGRAC